jgi:tRNA (guanine-N7-)-methyltransferase
MSRNKLVHFKENEENPNVVQAGKAVFETIKGNWNETQFQNDHPLVVELACGRGEFTVGLARNFPQQNFIGVDIKGSRIWMGSSTATAEGITNVAFLRTQIELIDKSFAADEISELWITFPDPYPRDGDEKRRLTSPRFLEMYKPMLKKAGIIHFKTDNTGLFDYTLELFQNRADIELLGFTHDFYQSEWKDEKIKYLKCRFV